MVHYILYIILYYYCYYDYIVFIIIIVIIEEFTNDNLSIYMYRDICVNCWSTAGRKSAAGIHSAVPGAVSQNHGGMDLVVNKPSETSTSHAYV